MTALRTLLDDVAEAIAATGQEAYVEAGFPSIAVPVPAGTVYLTFAHNVPGWEAAFDRAPGGSQEGLDDGPPATVPVAEVVAWAARVVGEVQP